VASKRGNPYARPDVHSQRARKQGYPARSVFKLEELDKRCQLIKKGDRILDLGAAPGSWALYAAQQVGPSGKVVAIDLTRITQAFPSNVEVIQGDAREERERLRELGPFDAVISDMSPRTSGTKFRDKVFSFELCMLALEIALELGGPNSHFVAKIFMSGEFPEAKRVVSRAFSKTRVVRPDVIRQNSTEV
jgi:23S rRNA (uridine2552-2'-O)-methyltransferase